MKSFANSMSSSLVREVPVVVLDVVDGRAREEYVADLAHREATLREDGLTAKMASS